MVCVQTNKWCPCKIAKSLCFDLLSDQETAVAQHATWNLLIYMWGQENGFPHARVIYFRLCAIYVQAVCFELAKKGFCTLLTSLILGLYYKLNWPKRASVVYWLLGTLLYPCSGDVKTWSLSTSEEFNDLKEGEAVRHSSNFFLNIVIFMGWWIPIYDILCSHFASLACLGWESGS